MGVRGDIEAFALPETVDSLVEVEELARGLDACAHVHVDKASPYLIDIARCWPEMSVHLEALEHGLFGVHKVTWVSAVTELGFNVPRDHGAIVAAFEALSDDLLSERIEYEWLVLAWRDLRALYQNADKCGWTVRCLHM